MLMLDKHVDIALEFVLIPLKLVLMLAEVVEKVVLILKELVMIRDDIC